MSSPNPQDPNSPLYEFVDTQPEDEYPQSRDSSFSHFTTRQYTPESITVAYPPVVTITGSNFSNGQAIRATQFVRYPIANDTGMYQLNNRLFYCYGCTSDTFQLGEANGTLVDGRGFSAYITGGQFTLVGPDILVVNPSEFPPSGIPEFPPA